VDHVPPSLDVDGAPGPAVSSATEDPQVGPARSSLAAVGGWAGPPQGPAPAGTYEEVVVPAGTWLRPRVLESAEERAFAAVVEALPVPPAGSLVVVVGVPGRPVTGDVIDQVRALLHARGRGAVALWLLFVHPLPADLLAWAEGRAARGVQVVYPLGAVRGGPGGTLWSGGGGWRRVTADPGRPGLAGPARDLGTVYSPLEVEAGLADVAGTARRGPDGVVFDDPRTPDAGVAPVGAAPDPALFTVTIGRDAGGVAFRVGERLVAVGELAALVAALPEWRGRPVVVVSGGAVDVEAGWALDDLLRPGSRPGSAPEREPRAGADPGAGALLPAPAPAPLPALADLEAKFFPPGLALGAGHAADTVVSPHVDGDAFFAAIAEVLDTLRGPGDRLWIASYWLDLDITLRRGPGQPRLGELLLDLAGAGVDVRVIAAAPRFSVGVEGFGPTQAAYWLAAMSAGVGAAHVPRLNVRAVRALRSGRRGGAAPLQRRVLLDWGGWLDSRHEKSVVAYSASTGELHAFVGGIDLAALRPAEEYHLRSPWHDAGLQLRGGAAVEVLENFRTRWRETVTLPRQRYRLDGIAEEFNPDAEELLPAAAPPLPALPATVPAGSYADASVRVLRSYEGTRAHGVWGPYSRAGIGWNGLPPTGVTEIADTLQNAIAAATRYIYIEDQTLNGSRVEHVYVRHELLYPLITAACARGVKVIFVTQGISADPEPGPAHLSMSTEIERLILGPLTAAQRDNFALLYVEGVKVHSKVVIVDDEFVSIGSANLWDRSMNGAESELTAAMVHPGGADSLAGDLRVRLWRDHLRVAPGPVVDAELRDLSRSLGLFRASWGSGVSFPYPYSRLVEITRGGSEQ
jgi:phosphatidylserine/phosphatidylglycerophosphate/cardiolipin synthase-like enzyme